MPGVTGFYRLTVFMKQAEVEIEAVRLMPTERARGAGETTADRPCGVEPDQVQAFGGPRFIQGPGDLLGARVTQLYQGQTLEPGVEGPFERTL